MSRRFIKKPIEIEAFRYCFDAEPEWSLKSPDVNHCQTNNDMWLEITTLEGVMRANPGDFIIKGIQGEIYPCKSDIFWKSYEEVHSNYVVKASDCKSFDPKLWNNNGNIIPVIDNE